MLRNKAARSCRAADDRCDAPTRTAPNRRGARDCRHGGLMLWAVVVVLGVVPQLTSSFSICGALSHHRAALRRAPALAPRFVLSESPRQPRCITVFNAGAAESTADTLAVLSLPTEPSSELSAEDVVFAVIKGLQYNDVPCEDAGLERLYRFSDLYCRFSITARQGAKTVERFKEYAESPAFAALVRAERWEASLCRIIPAPLETPTRGDYAVCMVTVSEDKGFRFRSGIERRADFEEAVGDAGRVITQFKITLEKQRRPPLTGCWLFHECVSAKDEFLYNGDTGGTTTD